ncbi:hypothetical protein HDU85_003341 [Gaertneriomyces sp. JEL0708]|nr:hypothetical protein HDU85_003341 [Gaertneriomyces sp. JEL0708]
MSRHSKNNTALSFFTHAEKQKLNYGTQKQRLGRDSFRNFNACFLCLATARDPVSCLQGHISCKECMYENILQQKKEITRQRSLYEGQQRALIEQNAQDVRAQEEAELQKFQRTETHFLPAATSTPTATPAPKQSQAGPTQPSDARSHDAHPIPVNGGTPHSGNSTPAPTDALPSFWVPSLTPAAKPDIVDAPKAETLCTATHDHHPVSIKKLINVNFTPVKGSETEHICPACFKTLTNGTKMAILRTCGHVLCKGCCTKFVLSSQKCQICEKKCKERDVIKLSVEGTGFVAAGNVEAKRTSVAFQ